LRNQQVLSLDFAAREATEDFVHHSE